MRLLILISIQWFWKNYRKFVRFLINCLIFICNQLIVFWVLIWLFLKNKELLFWKLVNCGMKLFIVQFQYIELIMNQFWWCFCCYKLFVFRILLWIWVENFINSFMNWVLQFFCLRDLFLLVLMWFLLFWWLISFSCGQ